jgi:hypothetical protein
VKLSRTSLAFFALGVLPPLLFLTTKGAGSWTTIFAGAGFLAADRVTGVFAGGVAALATAAVLFLAGFAAAGAAGLTGRGRGAGLGVGDKERAAAARVRGYPPTRRMRAAFGISVTRDLVYALMHA